MSLKWIENGKGRGLGSKNLHKNKPIVRVRKSTLSFTDTAVELMKFPKRILLGYDVETNNIYFKPTEQEEGLKFSKHVTDVMSSYFNDVSAQYLNTMLKKEGIDLANFYKKSYSLKFDKNENAYYINLNEAC
jgi:hypothetical protein